MPNRPQSLSLDNWQICEDFQQGWNKGERPKLVAYLNRCREQAARANLFWHLLEIELEHRRQRGEVPLFEDYQEFAVEFRDVLRQCLSGLGAESGKAKASAPAARP